MREALKAFLFCEALVLATMDKMKNGELKIRKNSMA